jgi:predicted AlkP superfamily pyrophosphatase or phosphodiesterase
LAATASLLPAQAPQERHVVVISVDGMGSSYYVTPPPGLRTPNLRSLMQAGSYAEAVEGVYPTVTYPSHTTLITGRRPAEHGIYTNLASREPGQHAGDWFWFAKAIKVPTLWDEARKHHLTTAAIAWPVSVGAPIDWNVPEIWDPSKPPGLDMMYLAKFMNPLVGAELLGALGLPAPGADPDTLKARLALYLIKEHKPNLTLIHLVDLDETEHEHGPGSPQALATLAHVDNLIGQVMEAVKQAGLESSTDVFVVSDHGFLPVRRLLRPNVLLVNAGLLTADPQGHLTGGKVMTVANGGSFFIYWPAKQNRQAEILSALKPLLDAGLAWAVLDQQALKELGGDPDARLAVEAPEGTAFVDSARGNLIVEQEAVTGTHGYLPFRHGLESAFLAHGPHIQAGVNLHRIPMTRIAPTILQAMGVDDPQFGDDPPLREVLVRRGRLPRAPGRVRPRRAASP